MFNGKNNFYDSNESREYIKQFCISGSISSDDAGFELFCQRLEKYKQTHGSKMRKIKCFTFDVFDGSVYYNFNSNKDWTMSKSLKKLFLSCCSVSESINIECDINKLGINNVNELKEMFHSNLKRFSFKSGKFSDNINIDNYNLTKAVGMLEEIEMTNGVHVYPDSNLFIALGLFDKLNIRNSIKRYIINWKVSHEEPVKRDQFLNKLFFQDSDKHPLLESVVFNTGIINAVTSILPYLVEYKQEIFKTKKIKLKLKHLQTIELVMESSSDFDAVTERINESRDTLSLSDYENEPFVANKSTIRIANNVGQCIDDIPTYILNWIARISDAQQRFGVRRVVLTV